MTTVNASVALSRDGEQHYPMVPNVLLSQENEILPATVTTIEGRIDDAVGSTSKGQREECSHPSMSLELELKKVRENTMAVNEHEVLLRNVEKTVDKAD